MHVLEAPRNEDQCSSAVSQQEGYYPELAHAQAAVRDHLVPATPLDVTGPEDGKIPCFLEVHHIRPSLKA